MPVEVFSAESTSPCISREIASALRAVMNPIVFDIRLRQVDAMAVVAEPPSSTDLMQLLVGAMLTGMRGDAPQSNPVSAQDSDGDGLSDYEETVQYHSDPARADTDGDGYADGEEVKNGYNPGGPGQLPPPPSPPIPPQPSSTGEAGFVPSQLDQALDNTQKQRDEKRIADIMQIQTALELYYSDQSAYPALAGSVTLGEGNFGCLSSRGFFPAGLCKEIIYMGKIPANPQPGGGPYRYTFTSGDNYEIRFWLEGGARSLPAGEIIASPDGIKPAGSQ